MSSRGVLSFQNNYGSTIRPLPDFIYERCNNTFPPLPYPPKGSHIRIGCYSVRSTTAAKAGIIFACLAIMGAFVTGILLYSSPFVALGCLVGSVMLALLMIVILSVSALRTRDLRYQAETRLTDEMNYSDRLLKEYNILVEDYNSLLTDTESIEKEKETKSEYGDSSDLSFSSDDSSSLISPSDRASLCRVYTNSPSPVSRKEFRELRSEIRKLRDTIFLFHCELSPIRNPYHSPASISSFSSSSSSS